MDMLLLGGTAFLGRAVARAALAAGWEVTCLARGSSDVPAGTRIVRADRDAADALDPVTHQDWDAVVDLTRQPRHARRAARELRTRHWVFISSGVHAWMGPNSLPLWIDDPAWRYFATLDTTAARAAGLTTRELGETLRAALAYGETRTEPRLAGLSGDGERRLRSLLR